MIRRIAVLLLAWIAAGLAPAAAAADLRWHWEDEFSAAERRKLIAWIDTVAAEIEGFIAPYPFPVDIHFHRAEGRSPVPWANTVRYQRQGVNIHVNPTYSRDELLADWTAWHELSHLLLPFLGQRHAWFAEGFASYMQYQAMHAAGIISRNEMAARYASRIEQAASNYDLPDRTLVEAAPILRSRREYPTMYWGGAAFFLGIDAELRIAGHSLPAVLREYVRCCRQSSGRLDELVATFDRIAGGELFRRRLEEIRTRPGFPDVDAVAEDG